MGNKSIRIKNVGKDNTPLRFIKMTNGSNVNIEPLATGEVNSFVTTPETIDVCLAPMKVNPVTVVEGDDAMVGELIIANAVSTRYTGAETINIVTVTPNAETTIDVLFASRMNNGVTVGTIRKQQYFLNLGNATTLGLPDVSKFSILSSKYNAGTDELIGTYNETLTKNKCAILANGDIIYPMVISEEDVNARIELIIDLDGDRTLFAPAFHRLNVNVTVENNSAISPVNVRGFDTLFETELAGYTFAEQAKEGNSFSISSVAATSETDIRKNINTLFQYKIDDSIILKQSFVIELEHWLVDDSSEVTLTIGTTTYNKAQIIAKSVLLNNKYYYLVTFNNKNTTGTTVEVEADYDGIYKDFVKTNYQFIFVSTLTSPPAIPMFALSSRMARVEVKNENTYYYEGYRYLQFKVPVTEPAMVGIFPVISAENYSVKALSTSKTLTPIEDKQKLADFFRLGIDSTLMNYDPNKQIMFGFEKAGEAIFQVAVPSGITGQIYFTLRPVGGTGNLLYYDDVKMQLRGVVDRLPPPNYYSTNINHNSLTEVVATTPLNGYYLFNELLMPGQAIAFDSIFTSESYLALIDQRHQYIDIIDDYSQVVNNKPDYAFPLIFQSRRLTSYRLYTHPTTGVETTTGFEIDFTREEYLDDWLTSKMLVLFRSPTNQLYLIDYVKSDGIAISVNAVIELSPDLSKHKFGLNDGMKILINVKNSTYDKITEITKPYNVTFEELTVFETNQTLEMATMVRLTDISGYDNDA